MAIQDGVLKVNGGVARIELCVRRTKMFGDTLAMPGDRVTVTGERPCSMVGNNVDARGYYWLALYGEGASEAHTYLWSDGHRINEAESLQEAIEKSGADRNEEQAEEQDDGDDGYTISDVIAALDRLAPEDFGSSGKPKAASVDREVGAKVSKADREEATRLWEEGQEAD